MRLRPDRLALGAAACAQLETRRSRSRSSRIWKSMKTSRSTRIVPRESSSDSTMRADGCDCWVMEQVLSEMEREGIAFHESLSLQRCLCNAALAALSVKRCRGNCHQRPAMPVSSIYRNSLFNSLSSALDARGVLLFGGRNQNSDADGCIIVGGVHFAQGQYPQRPGNGFARSALCIALVEKLPDQPRFTRSGATEKSDLVELDTCDYRSSPV